MPRKFIGDTILPANNVPRYVGEYDDSVYNPSTKRGGTAWLSALLIAHIPLPPLGSMFPYFYCAFVAHLFFRSITVVVIAILVWAVVSTMYALLLKALDLPILWPRYLPPVQEHPEDPSSSIITKKTMVIHNASPQDWFDASVEARKGTISSRNTKTVRTSKGEIIVVTRSEENNALGQPWTLKGHYYKYWVDFEDVLVTTALWNPILGIVGMFLSWFTVRALSLQPFNTRLVTDSSVPEVNFLLVVEFLVFALITLKLGKNTLWLWTLIGVPIYILGVMAPMNKAYTHGYDEFEPYLYWLLFTIYFCLWFLRDPFGVQQILETGSLTKSRKKSKPQTDSNTQPFYIVTQKRETGMKNSYYFWSIDGTYMWNAFFSITLLIMIISLYKVIELAT